MLRFFGLKKHQKNQNYEYKITYDNNRIWILHSPFKCGFNFVSIKLYRICTF